MAVGLDEIFNVLQEIKDALPALISNTRIAPQQVTIVQGLSELSETLGLMMAGEFRAGNGQEPGRGFTGVRIGYPPFSYASQLWHIAGIGNDAIQFGLNAADGTAWAGGGAVRMTSGGILVYNGAVQTGAIEADGDVKFGSNLTAPGTTSLIVFASSQVYNAETMGAGDVLIGDNSTGKANMLWDSSASELQFRVGTTIMNRISTGTLLSPGCKLRRSTNQSIASGAGLVAVQFDVEEYDDASFADLAAANTKITIPTGMGGTYLLGCYYGWASNISHNAVIYINNTYSIAGVFTTTLLMTLVGEAALVAGDYVELRVQQTTGSPQDIAAVNNRPNLWLRRVR